jgi:hypothetical protein
MPRSIASTPLAVRRKIAFDDIAQVGDRVGLGRSRPQFNAGRVEVFLRSRRRPVGHHGDVAIGDDLDRLFHADSAEVAGLGAEVIDDFAAVAKRNPVSRPCTLPTLISSMSWSQRNEQQPDLVLRSRRVVQIWSGRQDQRLHRGDRGTLRKIATSGQVL